MPNIYDNTAANATTNDSKERQCEVTWAHSELVWPASLLDHQLHTDIVNVNMTLQ